MIPDWLLPHLGPYREVRRGGRRLEEIVGARLPAMALEGLRRASLVVLRPDALLDERGADILDYLEDELGVVSLRLRIVALSPALFDALYRFKMASFGDNVWLHHRLVDGRPAAFVLVIGPPADAPSLSERLDDLKGPSSPAAGGDAESLRGRFRRASSFHSVVHVPQDPGAFLYESSLVFPWSTIRAVLELAAGPDSGECGALPREVRRCLLVPVPPTGESVFATVLRVKRRILAALTLQAAGEDAGLIQELWDLTGTLALDPGQPYLAQREAFLGFARRERPLLEAAIARQQARLPAALAVGLPATATPEECWPVIEDVTAPLRLLYATWHLSGHDPYTLDDGAELFRLLARHSIPLPAWQQTVVQAALRNDLNPSASWEGLRQYPLGAW